MRHWLWLALIPTLVLAKGEIREPEAATGRHQQQAVVGNKLMMATANPLASQAGFAILKQGGSAVDAIIAAEMVLNLVEPQSSGVGGGAFMLVWDEKAKTIKTMDAREMAPKADTPELFMENGKPMDFFKALVGGRSVGVPGVVKGFWEAHQKYGKLPWASLFQPAIKLAEDGFIVSPRLAELLRIEMNPGLRTSPTAKDYFFPGGQALKAGQRLKNPAFAKTLKAIAKDGPKAFYEGDLAKAIVATVRGHASNPGQMALGDLRDYRPIWRGVVCGPYRQYQVCGAPPPAGGLVVTQQLGILNKLPPISNWDLAGVHRFTQASRLAFADRNRYEGDPAFVPVPMKAMLDDKYLTRRSGLVGDSDKFALPGDFGPRADTKSPELPCTSHLVAIDKDGNAVSMTASIEMGFGSTLMVGGFLLNNELTDFNFGDKDAQGRWVANRVQGGKRPRSSMSPTMVLYKGELQGMVGSPGGSRIINYVTKTLVGVIDGGLDIQAAIDLPNVTNRNDYTAVEKGTVAEDWVQGLKARGHDVRVIDLNSGLQGIWRLPDGRWQGGADPRREGKVLAQ
ncbi:gamma-glutamyltransferase [Gallaecimonas kandeliae]|uniref:gamma-glutamyltransferase n=1 Tax=Gallaecimonas kandeliae TaxID=3029055 RepID=UPI0026486E09|nr:gamma-glutamyltransferase [Gallaecimonas kandeliae]WKE63964.1 gamma-glutamyltransferase [Gallaecimonas kandeliae]